MAASYSSSLTISLRKLLPQLGSSPDPELHVKPSTQHLHRCFISISNPMYPKLDASSPPKPVLPHVLPVSVSDQSFLLTDYMKTTESPLTALLLPRTDGQGAPAKPAQDITRVTTSPLPNRRRPPLPSSLAWTTTITFPLLPLLPSPSPLQHHFHGAG